MHDFGHAAALTWWPDLQAPVRTAAASTPIAAFPGYRFSRIRVPAALVMQRRGVRLSAPALTVLDLVDDLGGAAIDEALRRGAVSLEGLAEALDLTGHRRGNARPRWLLEDSRDRPWSPAERNLHRLYRGLGLSWRHRTNHRVILPTRNALIDLALPDLRLGYEVDGHAHHRERHDFIRDRTRDPELVEAGWVIVRFAAASLTDRPAWVAGRIRAITAARALDLGYAGTTGEGRHRWGQ